MKRRAVAILLVGVAAAAGCAADGDDTEPLADVVESIDSTDATDGVEPADADQFPEILDVEATRDGAANTWNFAVTISSPYDSPSRYADGWRVVGPDGTVYGVHTLTHDHAAEQPFTRRQSGVEIPDGVDVVTIEGRDLVNGFGGITQTVELEPGSS